MLLLLLLLLMPLLLPLRVLLRVLRGVEALVWVVRVVRRDTGVHRPGPLLALVLWLWLWLWLHFTAWCVVLAPVVVAVAFRRELLKQQLQRSVVRGPHYVRLRRANQPA